MGDGRGALGSFYCWILERGWWAEGRWQAQATCPRLPAVACQPNTPHCTALSPFRLPPAPAPPGHRDHQKRVQHPQHALPHPAPQRGQRGVQAAAGQGAGPSHNAMHISQAGQRVHHPVHPAFSQAIQGLRHHPYTEQSLTRRLGSVCTILSILPSARQSKDCGVTLTLNSR